MPLRFLADGTESFTAKEVNQEHLGNVIGALSTEMRNTIFGAPCIHCFSAVPREGCNLICRQYIRTAYQQCGVIAVELFQRPFGKAFGHSGAFLCPIPSGGSGISFGVVISLPEVFLHILFSDSIAPCLFPGILARHSSALQQVACCGFADPAEPIEPVFIDDIRDLIPVDPFIHFLTPQGKYFGCKCCPSVYVLPHKERTLIFSLFSLQKSSCAYARYLYPGSNPNPFPG